MNIVILYLVAIVAANLTIAAFGPAWSIINAFLFIGLDLSARDTLHERWQGNALWRKMFALVLAGASLSALLNVNVLSIAIASCISFAVSGILDAIVYGRLIKHPRLVRMNASNIAAAAADSILFPALAFGFPLLWPVMIGQFIAKIGGGMLWSIILTQKALRLRPMG